MTQSLQSLSSKKTVQQNKDTGFTLLRNVPVIQVFIVNEFAILETKNRPK